MSSSSSVARKQQPPPPTAGHCGAGHYPLHEFPPLHDETRSKTMNERSIVLADDHHDGFSDPNFRGSRSIIKGTKIKFTNDFRWLAGGDEINPAREFLVIEVLRVIQKWPPSGLSNLRGPIETRILKPDERPNVEELNDATPRSEWRDKFGEFEGPWEFSYALYLLEPKTMGAFTYLTGMTVGGCQAVDELKDATVRARLLQGASYFPLVTLGKVHMPTDFGGRDRPMFIVKTFVALGPASERAPTIAGPGTPTIDAKKTEAKRGDSYIEMKDGIPS
jgi:hypothetical protein